MRVQYALFLTLFTFFRWVVLYAQPADSVKKPVSIFPFPIVYYTPETRFAYGAVLSTTFRFRRDFRLLRQDSARLKLPGTDWPRPSNIQLLGAYTQNKQILLFVPFQLFYDHNQYYVYGEAGYYQYSYNFYGVGLREVPAENYAVNYPRIRLNALRRIWPHLYAGLRYEYENYRITSVKPGGLLASGTVPGGSGGRMAGGGTGLFYDTRDNVFYPTRGFLADLSYLAHGQLVGSEFRFNRYVADLSSYFKLNHRAILAVNYVVSITGGLAPFSALSLLGGGRRLRGYYEGRYRDKNMTLLQAEGRFTIWKRLTAVAFGGIGFMGDDNQLFRLNAPKGAYGAGLRFRMNNDGLNIRADYGFGKQSTGLYLTIGEAF
ncbi:BamA/TamA family outer membrane protein [Spirosoma taeanense]|uniref:BamA/TamA family outer membrane protein n=1 Tax=Spirosoma taeanense TaxID=2735870 RepID=A0A6M5YCJ8_9BACT|nr:BamA/TamA family outer membrane protein [Spirosoma taeanense]QJW91000.1 BamA/TamA family outer membrane protein [Spirosoma taeanense]